MTTAVTTVATEASGNFNDSLPGIRAKISFTEESFAYIKINLVNSLTNEVIVMETEGAVDIVADVINITGSLNMLDTPAQ